MVVRLKWSALGESKWYEYVARFALGGAATVAAGLIADRWGPETGGLFLAFPAIFFASATLIEKHERKRKREKALRGERRGTDAAALDAAGAGWGSLGLMVFGGVVWILAARSVPLSLAVGLLAWMLSGVLAWRLRRALRR